MTLQRLLQSTKHALSSYLFLPSLFLLFIIYQIRYNNIINFVVLYDASTQWVNVNVSYITMYL